jgi:hypothetical protein
MSATTQAWRGKRLRQSPIMAGEESTPVTWYCAAMK